MSLDLTKAYETRDFVVKRLHEDLLGGPFDEVLREEPLARFVVGILYPEVQGHGPARREPAIDEEQVDQGAGPSDDAPQVDGAEGSGVSLSRMRYPRSIGMTFAVDKSTKQTLDVTVSAGRYTEEDAEEPLWRRHDEEWQVPVDPRTPGNQRFPLTDGLALRAVVRPARDGTIAVTLVMVNTATASAGSKDAACWFNPTVAVKAPAGVLVPRPESVIAGLDDQEIASQQLLFRDVKSYAIGHGCSVEWNPGTDPTRVNTTFLPDHELLLSNPGGAAHLDLSMEALAQDQEFTVLDDLLAEYQGWIDSLPARAADLSAEDRTTLNRHITEATESADRIQAGIRLLREDSDVRRAFQLMNRAMAQQRSRQEFHRSGGVGDPPHNADARWRAFQIAFILINLRGLAEPDSRDRSLADLLWFPTGGGKTEAYLGIIAIAILLRRLRNPEDAGVSVIMRYTLRLLTLQQYQRATGLICALEHLRLQELPTAKPITIGLWVGQATTPNSIKDAKAALNAAKTGQSIGEGADPVQLRQCPWCASALTARNYKIVSNSMVVECPNNGCFFRNGLPVNIIDEDVYSSRPALIIATVDKFAMMPWKREVGSLFGLGAGDSDPPPDLIVQDELHLISGPLGTIVGLYETAVDAACSRPNPPKIVASTATIRRAAAQVQAVFSRDARQFPPPGSTQGDSYFAVEAAANDKGSRAYVGVMAPGTSQATLMVRVYASLLQSAAQVPPEDPGADLYWTLLGYFNSLRVLGGAYIQVIDDVPDQMGVIATRRGEARRDIDEPREMTSRKKSSEIPTELAILERQRGQSDAADVVLATNMISVGVDVDRLGLMVVMGQPQTSAEYIQATSRVGRRHPGLVVTVFNASRSRDLSHYEGFTAYHRAMYRHVEATGATPFAPRARDRALHGVLVALARLLVPAAAPDKAAADISQWSEQVEDCIDLIVDRARSVQSTDVNVPADESPDRIREELLDLLGWWQSSRADRFPGWFGKTHGALLSEASRTLLNSDDTTHSLPPTETPWPTLTSMRDVDADSSLFLVPPTKGSSRGK